MASLDSPQKVPCKKCAAWILPVTARRTNGLCRPCANVAWKEFAQLQLAARRLTAGTEVQPYSEWNRPHNAIRNCNVTLDVSCPLDWNTLEATAEKGVRFCRFCQERVYFCSSENEALTHARAGHCVALPGEDGAAGGQVGRPVRTPEQEALFRTNLADLAITDSVQAATKRSVQKD